MKTFLSFLSVSMIISVFFTPNSRATVVVAEPSRMIFESDLIVDGILLVKGNEVSISVMSVFKGDVEIGKEHQITSQYSPMGFNLEKILKTADGTRCIILGDRDESGQIVLPWLQFSIWPLAIRYKSLQSSFDACQSYLLTVLNYEKTSKTDGESAVVSQLLQDMRDPDLRLAVIGFLNNFQKKNALKQTSIDALFAAMIGIQIEEGASTHSHNRDIGELIRIFDYQFPVSLVLRYYLILLDSDDPDSDLIMSNAISIVHGWTRSDAMKKRNIDELKADIQLIMTRIQIHDAEKALLFFDSDIPAVRQNASNILFLILQDEGNTDFPEQETVKKSYWVEKINTKKAALNDLR